MPDPSPLFSLAFRALCAAGFAWLLVALLLRAVAGPWERPR